ncbi:unnamed protein product [Strongylus vulgaris]|uniref:Uncharacterized protein n=1 Tax=Strongylus vulgaris TaxID=40348 RepID=A0A3P7JP81_STRVU|nr:unnamed protein product [Strongylus vulgaris]
MVLMLVFSVSASKAKSSLVSHQIKILSGLPVVISVVEISKDEDVLSNIFSDVGAVLDKASADFSVLDSVNVGTVLDKASVDFSVLDTVKV